MSGAIHHASKPTRAQAMRDAGLTFEAIARELGCAHSTVMRWTDEGYAERCRVQLRARRVVGSSHKMKTGLLRRAIEMRRLGASWPGIAVAIQVHEGVKVVPETIRKYVLEMEPTLPRKPRGNAYRSAS